MLCLNEMMDVHSIYCGHHLTMYVSQILMLYTNLYSAVCQLYLNKTGRKGKRKENEFQENMPFPVGGPSEHEASQRILGTPLIQRALLGSWHQGHTETSQTVRVLRNTERSGAHADMLLLTPYPEA